MLPSRLQTPAHLLLRVSWVFGVYGTNFVKTMLRLGRERGEVRVVADQTGGPTEARDIADAILAMAIACRQPGFSAWGVYHFAGAPSTSWYGFAQEIFERAGGPTATDRADCQSRLSDAGGTAAEFDA